MVTFTVHEQTSASGDIAARADGVAFVKEGFAWLALFFPLLWLLYYRMWIVLAGFVGVIAAMEIGAQAAGLVEDVAAWATTALTLVFAFQANDLLRWSLARRGYRLERPVSGPSLAACEARYFEAWLAAQEAGAESEPEQAARQAQPAATKQPQPAPLKLDNSDDVIGLFPDANP